MIDKVGGVILKDKKILVQRKNYGRHSVLFLVVNEKDVSLILRH